MIFYDANSPAPNPATVRQFILERGGLNLNVEQIDLNNLANRDADYINNVNQRGEVPALRLDDGTVITEITAICGYLDEVAIGGESLIGDCPQSRAVTNMWVSRVYLEIIEPMVTWWRGTDMAIEFYCGHREPSTSTQDWMKSQALKGLEQLNRDLEGRQFICNEKLTLADIILNAFICTMAFVVPWLERPDLVHFTRWRKLMAERSSSQAMLAPLPEQVG